MEREKKDTWRAEGQAPWHLEVLLQVGYITWHIGRNLEKGILSVIQGAEQSFGFVANFQMSQVT